MGLNESGNVLYLNASCGFLVNKKKEIKARSYTGLLIDLKIEDDEYEGKPIIKGIIFLKDVDKEGEDEIAHISFTLESWCGYGFFSRAEKIDLAKKITFGVSSADQNEKITFCWIKQGTSTVKKDESYPVCEKVIVGKNTVVDWTKFVDAAKKTMDVIKTKLASNDDVLDDKGNKLF